jgi:hypothetical protein
MRQLPEIENIEAMRRLAGINDVELYDQVRRLHVGDCVRLTLLPADGHTAGAVVLVRITSIKDGTFRGRVFGNADASRPPGPCQGCLVAFTPDHIHSIPKSKPARAH